MNMEINKLFHHCLYVKEEDGWYIPMRYTDERVKMYAEKYPASPYAASPAGVTLECITDAKEISFDFEFSSMCGGDYSFSDMLDVWENGEHKYLQFMAFHRGSFHYIKESAGRAHICIYLPCAGVLKLKNLDFGYWEAVEMPQNKLLIIGDSISQGLFAVHPSLALAPRIFRDYGWDYFNSSVGGDYHRDDLIPESLPFEPQKILVKLGVNDWVFIGDKAVIAKNIEAFYESLDIRFKGVPVYVISPCWATDWETRTDGRPEYTDWAYDYILKVTGAYKNVTVIDGMYVIPHEYRCFSDNTHPSDYGFERMTKNVAKVMFGK